MCILYLQSNSFCTIIILKSISYLKPWPHIPFPFTRFCLCATLILVALTACLPFLKKLLFLLFYFFLYKIMFFIMMTFKIQTIPCFCICDTTINILILKITMSYQETEYTFGASVFYSISNLIIIAVPWMWNL